MATHLELKAEAQAHRNRADGAVKSARAIQDHYTGKTMPADVLKKMRDHLRDAEHHRQEAEIKAHEAHMAEPQYKHDMVGAEDFDGRDRDLHPLAMPNDMPDQIAASMREGKSFQWMQTKAALATTSVGTSTTFAGTTPPPALLLHSFAGVRRVGTDGVKAAFPQWDLPTSAAGVSEGSSVSEYDEGTAGALTLARYGRWTEINSEAEVSAGVGDVLALHRLAIAKDLNAALIAALTAAHGTIVTYATSAEHMLRLAVANVAGNLGVEPTSVTLAVNGADFANLGFSPSNGDDVGSVVVRFAGAKLFVTPAVTAGQAVAFHGPMAAKFYEARALEVITDRDPKTAKWTIGSHDTGGYGVGLSDGVSYVDISAS